MQMYQETDWPLCQSTVLCTAVVKAAQIVQTHQGKIVCTVASACLGLGGQRLIPKPQDVGCVLGYVECSEKTSNRSLMTVADCLAWMRSMASPQALWNL